jgi:hypothetical protein
MASFDPFDQWGLLKHGLFNAFKRPCSTLYCKRLLSTIAYIKESHYQGSRYDDVSTNLTAFAPFGYSSWAPCGLIFWIKTSFVFGTPKVAAVVAVLSAFVYVDDVKRSGGCAGGSLSGLVGPFIVTQVSQRWTVWCNAWTWNTRALLD